MKKKFPWPILLIGFLVFVFINVIVSVKLVNDKGQIVQVEPFPTGSTTESQGKEVAPRNIFSIVIHPGGGITVNDKDFGIDTLQTEVLKFLRNEGENPDYSTSYDDAVVHIQTHKDAPYESYIEVYSASKGAFEEIRNDYALEEFGQSYQDLPEEEQKIVRNKYKLKLAERLLDETEM